jgi:adenylylsulfate kinase-like enzyme
MIYLFFGQPCSGKTTLGKYLTEYLSHEKHVIHIDGDEYRQITGNSGFDRSSRTENLKSAFNTALFLETKGYIVVLSFVTPYIESRLYLKDRQPDAKFIYLEYNPKKQKRGREKYHVSEFEEPSYEELINKNYTHINTTKLSEKECFTKMTLL